MLQVNKEFRLCGSINNTVLNIVGVYTGSVYSDATLYESLPGEKYCDYSVGIPYYSNGHIFTIYSSLTFRNAFKIIFKYLLNV